MYIKFSFKRFVCYTILFFPVVFLFFSIISGDLARNIIQLLIIFLLVCAIMKQKISELLFLAIFTFFVMINALRFGISYVFHQDFYGFLLLLLIMRVFSYQDYYVELIDIALYKQKATIMLIAFSIILLGDILFGGGVRQSHEWGVSLPMLYGPFELPHAMAYMLIAIFCTAASLYHKVKHKGLLICMVVSSFAVGWTGVRSASLALIIILLIEYVIYKRTSKKIIIMVVGICIAIYMMFFTDFIIENPIMQKTLMALSKGSITNHRADFNSYLTNIYVHQTNIMDKLFGISISGIRKAMYLMHGIEIHAHNDFLNTLLGMGILGFLLFIYSMVKFCKISKHWLVPFAVLFCLAFTNGLYMYIGFVPCLPLVLIYYRELFSFIPQKIGVENE